MLYLGGTEIHLRATGSTRKTWGTRSYRAGEEVVAVRTNESGSQRVTFLAGDRHGTSSLAIDATTQAVIRRYTTPFGAPRGTGPGNWPDDKRFLGKPTDPGTGLTHIAFTSSPPSAVPSTACALRFIRSMRLVRARRIR
ncbi:hypothetical protein STENM327S_02335 [Streptomyces tendae]